MSMTRRDIEERMMDYLYDELSPEEQIAFEGSIEEYPDLARELNELRETRSSFAPLHGHVDPSVPGLVRATVLREARLTADTDTAAASLFDRVGAFLLRPAFATAFVTIVVAGVGFAVLERGGTVREDGVAELKPSTEVAAPAPAAAPAAAPASGVVRVTARIDELTEEAESGLDEKNELSGTTGTLRRVAESPPPPVAEPTDRLERASGGTMANAADPARSSVLSTKKSGRGEEGFGFAAKASKVSSISEQEGPTQRRAMGGLKKAVWEPEARRFNEPGERTAGSKNFRTKSKMPAKKAALEEWKAMSADSDQAPVLAKRARAEQEEPLVVGAAPADSPLTVQRYALASDDESGAGSEISEAEQRGIEDDHDGNARELGLVSFDRADYVDAVINLERARAQGPPDPAFLEHRLAQAYARSSRPSTALRAYARLFESYPDYRHHMAALQEALELAIRSNALDEADAFVETLSELSLSGDMVTAYRARIQSRRAALRAPAKTVPATQKSKANSYQE